jgi:hypothetical protein
MLEIRPGKRTLTAMLGNRQQDEKFGQGPGGKSASFRI